MSDADLIGAVLGVFLPLVIAVIQKRKWHTVVRTAVAYGVYVLATGLTMWFANTYTDALVEPRDWVRVLLVIFGVAYTAFKFAWQPLGATQAIEKKTGG